jgi:hypothetical protein
MVSHLFFWPRWIPNLLPAQPTFEVEYGVHDAAGPTPDARIDFLGRILLTRPSSPSQASECDSECNSESNSESASISKIRNESKLEHQPLLLVVPAEIRQQIWKDVLGEFAVHLKLERRRLKGWIGLSSDPSNCNSSKAFRYGPGRLDFKRRKIISLLLICR